MSHRETFLTKLSSDVIGSGRKLDSKYKKNQKKVRASGNFSVYKTNFTNKK